METTVKQIEKSKARLFMEKLVYHYTKDNYRMLSTLTKGDIDSNFHKTILKEWDMLDYFLNDVASECDFNTNMVEQNRGEDGSLITIYKVGSRYVRTTLLHEYEPMTYEFVSLKKKKVVVYDYEVIG